NRPWVSVVAIPCRLPAVPRGREMSFPARRVSDLAQVIDYTRNYRQNQADFGAETIILPDLREAGALAPLRLGRRRRVDHPADLGDLVRRKAAAPRVLVNDRLVVGEVD